MTQEQRIETLREVAAMPVADGEYTYGEYSDLAVTALEAGASIRALANFLRVSKSTLHRDLPQIRAVAAIHRGEDPTEAVEALVSHLGQQAEEKARKDKGSGNESVPYGTPVHVCPCCGHVFPEATP
jgi:hypothetical protein